MSNGPLKRDAEGECQKSDSATVVGNHSRVRIQTPEGNLESTLTCKITEDDVDENGCVRFPPSGECNCFHDDAEGECQKSDSAIVVDGQTVPIQDFSIDNSIDVRGDDHSIGVGDTTYQFSFTIEFEDEEEARKFREFFS